MFLNTIHINQKAPPGVLGGSMCSCKSCQEKYWSDQKKEIDMLKIMQEAQADKEYDDLTSTPEEQQTFEERCFNNFDILTTMDTKDQIAKIMLLHGNPDQVKEAMEYIKR